MEKKRYTGTIDFYLLADSDEDAKRILNKICEKLRSEQDNQANPLELHETPFGTLNARKIELK
jgi:uncharacterized membrane-anchored protein